MDRWKRGFIPICARSHNGKQTLGFRFSTGPYRRRTLALQKKTCSRSVCSGLEWRIKPCSIDNPLFYSVIVECNLRDHLKPEDGTFNKIKSEYKRRFKNYFLLGGSSGDIPSGRESQVSLIINEINIIFNITYCRGFNRFWWKNLRINLS